MLSCDYKLFCGFFVNSVSDNSYARYHGGMLSHVEANSLGNNGYSWQQILHYFYDYGTYNSEMTSGVIKIVALNHTQSVSLNYESNIYYHWKTCTICGCAHTKTAHTWVAQSGNGYTCSVCGMFSQNIVARDVQESVTY